MSDIPETVKAFIAEREHVIVAINNCHPENVADYWRWQGHAEARRQLGERLGFTLWKSAEGEQMLNSRLNIIATELSKQGIIDAQNNIMWVEHVPGTIRYLVGMRDGSVRWVSLNDLMPFAE